MRSKFSVSTEVEEYTDEYDRHHTVLENVIPESLSILCPHCGTYSAMRLEAIVNRPNWKFDLTCTCPHCENSVFVQAGYKEAVPTQEIEWPDGPVELIDPVPAFTEVTSVYPSTQKISLPPEIPSEYQSDYREAKLVLHLSPKASAALSRRLLQRVLREEYKIKHFSLAKEIDDFIQLAGIPSYITDEVDAIRNIGNFAAHPLKDTNTGEIVDVEPGEAEWLLEVLEVLTDFTFVQPKKLEKRKKRLNEKLKALGKLPMKD